MDNSITSLGLMSGTSLDGIDASIINSDGKTHLEVKANHFSQYKPDFRQKLRNYIKNINSIEDIKNSASEYKNLEKEVTLLHSDIAKKIISSQTIDVDLVGFHGQTIIHKPKKKYSIQMGNPNLLSQLIQKKVMVKVHL